MTNDLRALDNALDRIRDLLEHMKKMGRGVSISPAAMEALQRSGGGPFVVDSQPKKAASGKPPEKETPPVCNSLEDVRAWIGDCRRCPLAENRSKIVFGDGNPSADLMFIGEGPGGEEDRQGLPFVGPAGALLTRMIEGGLKKDRSQVYITNIVKCRPPGNRDPQPNEAVACRGFLNEQVRLIAPKVICALGRVAAHNLLDTTTPISKLRGTWHEVDGIKVIPTFHPAALLRNPDYKRPAWEDLQSIIAELGWT